MGKSVALDEINRFSEVFEDIVSHRDAYEKEIKTVVQKYVFNIGESGKIGAQYILSALFARQNQGKPL